MLYEGGTPGLISDVPPSWNRLNEGNVRWSRRSDKIRLDGFDGESRDIPHDRHQRERTGPVRTDGPASDNGPLAIDLAVVADRMLADVLLGHADLAVAGVDAGEGEPTDRVFTLALD